MPDSAGAGDQFGKAIAVGDLDGDGFADLAIGSPGEDLPGPLNAGAVVVLYGSSGGLTSAGNQLWTHDSPGIRDRSER